MSALQRHILRKHPELYFVIAAAILVAKVIGVPPTSFISWPIAILVVVLSCVFGVMGMKAKAQQQQ